MNEIADHLDEGQLQALADGELEPVDRTRVEEHLAGCAECRAELDELRRASLALSGALRELDRPRSDVLPFRPPPAKSPRSAAPAAVRSGWGALPRAAVLVLGFAAAASAAIPGSPVRGWVDSMLREGGAEVAAPTASTTAEPAELPTQEAEEAGVSIEAGDGPVRIVVDGAAPGVVVTASIVDAARAAVYASGAAAEARFTTGRGRIDVSGASGGSLRLEIPREAASATVTVNGTVRMIKQGERLRLSAAADAAGPDVTYRVR